VHAGMYALDSVLYFSDYTIDAHQIIRTLRYWISSRSTHVITALFEFLNLSDYNTTHIQESVANGDRNEDDDYLQRGSSSSLLYGSGAVSR
jgi:hypothetical protein